jgi:predicted transcriptional regulator
MTNQKLRRIPIEDCDNRIVGIITQADVATRSNQPEKTANMVKGISQKKLLPGDRLESPNLDGRNLKLNP